MPNTSQRNGIDMGNIASINGNAVVSSYDPLTSSDSDFIETFANTNMILYGGVSVRNNKDNFLNGPKVLFSSDVDGRFAITQQNTKNWTKFESSSVAFAGIDTDGKLWMSGTSNSYTHQTSDFTTLTQVTGVGDSDTAWTDVSLGGRFVLAINSGKLYSMGENNYGQQGTGNRTHRYSLAQVGSDSDWVMVCGSYQQSIAVKGVSGSQALYATGRNSYGQTGQGTSSGYLQSWTECIASDSDDYSDITMSYYTSFAVKGGKAYVSGYGGGTNELRGDDNTANYIYSFIQTGKIDATTYGTNWTKCHASNRTHSYLINSSGELWFTGHDQASSRINTGGNAKDGYYVKASVAGDNWTHIARADLGTTSTSANYEAKAGINNGKLYIWGYHSSVAAQINDTTDTTSSTRTPQVVNANNTCNYCHMIMVSPEGGGRANTARGVLACFNT